MAQRRVSAPRKTKKRRSTKMNLKVDPKRLAIGLVGGGGLAALPLVVLGLMFVINQPYALPMVETVVGILLIIVVLLLSLVTAAVGVVAVIKNEKITPKVLFTWGTGIIVPFFLSLWVVILGPTLAGWF